MRTASHSNSGHPNRGAPEGTPCEPGMAWAKGGDHEEVAGHVRGAVRARGVRQRRRRVGLARLQQRILLRSRAGDELLPGVLLSEHLVLRLAELLPEHELLLPGHGLQRAHRDVLFPPVLLRPRTLHVLPDDDVAVRLVTVRR